jgi:hypothetical protein
MLATSLSARNKAGRKYCGQTLVEWKLPKLQVAKKLRRGLIGPRRNCKQEKR